MPRQKKKARANSHKKPQQTAKTLAQLEKAFKAMPTQIVSHCRQELATLKQQNKELSATLKSAEALTTAIKKKCDTLASAKPTATAKKQLVAAKKGYAKAVQATRAITKELSAVADQVAGLSLISTKYTAFLKEWSTIEKQLLKNVVPFKPASKLKTKKVSKVVDSQRTQVENEPVEISDHASAETMEDIQNVETV